MNPGFRRTLPPTDDMPPPSPVEEEIPLELPLEEALEGEPLGQVPIPPEAVSFRDGTQICGNCEYMGADGMCEPLQIDVGPSDGCNLFKQGEADLPMEDELAQPL